MNANSVLKFTIISIFGITMSACATVDVTRVAKPTNTASTQSVNFNVVQKAASKLYSVFTSRGFVAKDSRRNMRAAARILLKGLEDKPLNTRVKYSETIKSSTELQSDIRLATEQVDLTRKAAEVFLAMAPGEASLKKELGSLQKALVASNEAKKSFVEALEIFETTSNEALFSNYNLSVTQLREVTDQFGYRVRSVALSVAVNTNS